ncbi:MAG: hypothetical protein IPM34_08850 [Saprospiraceae bacterium]|nr:hypothetical protein [Saprospiraceae bacterium]
MTYSRTTRGAIALLSVFLTFLSCSKTDVFIPESSSYLNEKDAGFLTDWVSLSLELSNQCNGYSEPITSRALLYTALSMYESLQPGLKGYGTLQLKLANFQTTLPQPDPGQKYNFLITANQALYRMTRELFKASGSDNLQKITALRDQYLNSESIELDPDIIKRSTDLGNEIGWKLIAFSEIDGKADAYLVVYPDFSISADPAAWRPTPPDYFSKPILPDWGSAQLCLADNLQIASELKTKVLNYSTSAQSIIYAEAYEVYNLSNNLDTHQRDYLEFWNTKMDFHASPLLHNYLLMMQLIEEKEMNLESAMKLFLRLAIAQYDAYIVSWKVKYETNLLRPSTYIKQQIDRYYIPEYSSPASPEFVADKAMIYSACARIFSETFGYRTPFMDYTQSMRQDLRENRKFFESFEQMAKEAAFSDLYSASQYRSSITTGLDAGNALAEKVMKLKLN